MKLRATRLSTHSAASKSWGMRVSLVRLKVEEASVAGYRFGV